jgi:hypothetical protein
MTENTVPMGTHFWAVIIGFGGMTIFLYVLTLLEENHVFCRHIYKMDNQEILYTEPTHLLGADGVDGDKKEHIAIKYTCIKCHKVKYTQHTRIITKK